MALGVFDLVGLAVSIAFAVPLAIYGAETALSGDPLGWALLAVAALLVLAQQALTTPDDLPTAVVQRLVGVVVRDPDEDYGESERS